MADSTTRTKLSPRRRSELVRYVLYGVLVIAALAAIFFADWGRIQRNFFNIESMREMLPEVITIAARNTVIYTVASFSLGIVGALVLALMKMSSVKPYKWIATVYIELFRGLPALITIILVAFGLPIAFGWRIPGGTLGTGSLGLAIVAAAYMAETIRAGVEAVPRGQMEAARSLGMSHARAMASIDRLGRYQRAFSKRNWV